MQKRGKSASRRWHPKTRTGCGTCKARKIKCDEQKPQCQNCIRHGVTCAFVTTADSSRQSSVAATSPQNSGDPSLSLNLRDLELLHHYTIYTAHTLTGDLVLNRFWTTEAVQLGYGCEFIMRGFLSLSAMHMASKFPDRAEDLVTTSMVHYNIASRLAMDLIPTAENDDGEKLFVFSVLTVYLVLCNSQNLKDAFAIGDDAAPNWMVLFKGTMHLAMSALQSNSNSIILPIVTRSKERYRFLDMEWETPYLDHLNMCLERWINTNPTPDPAISAVYQRAVRLLRKCFAVFFYIDQQRDLVDVFVWMSMVSGDFMPLLVSKDPPQEALSIFCYFGMLLRKVESQWWLDRWSHNLLIRIYELLDDEHRSWIVLPPGLELYKSSHQRTPDATS